jgi:hypothetical protein
MTGSRPSSDSCTKVADCSATEATKLSINNMTGTANVLNFMSNPFLQTKNYCFERTFRSEIVFQIPSPINNNPSIALRPVPPISSEEKFAPRTVIIMPVIIIPPLIKSNMDIAFEGTFLLTIKATIDITAATAPPKTISRTC